MPPYTTLGIPTTLVYASSHLFVGVHPPALPGTDTPRCCTAGYVHGRVDRCALLARGLTGRGEVLRDLSEGSLSDINDGKRRVTGLYPRV